MPEESRREAIISKGTLIPLAAVGVVIGFTFWLTNIWANGNQNTRDIAEIKTTIEQLSSLSDRMTRMETKLDILIEQIK